MDFSYIPNTSKRNAVNKLGQVISFIWKEPKILTPMKNSFGYMIVGLCLPGGDYEQKRVHRLVAEAFIPNPENKPQVNHKDSDPRNNNVENLEWVTPIENMHHAIKKNRMPFGDSHHHTRLTKVIIEEIRALALDGKIEQKEIALRYGIQQPLVSRIKHGYRIRNFQSEGL